MRGPADGPVEKPGVRALRTPGHGKLSFMVQVGGGGTPVCQLPGTMQGGAFGCAGQDPQQVFDPEGLLASPVVLRVLHPLSLEPHLSSHNYLRQSDSM